MSYYWDLSTAVDVLTSSAYGSSKDTSFHLAMSNDNVNDLGREMIEQQADYAKNVEDGVKSSATPTGETGGAGGGVWDVYEALEREERGNQGGSEDGGGGSSGSGGDYYPSDPTQG